MVAMNQRKLAPGVMAQWDLPRLESGQASCEEPPRGGAGRIPLVALVLLIDIMY